MDYSKLMFGDKAIHIPAWLIAQDQAKDAIGFVGATRSLALRFGSALPHQLIVCDLMIRPHLVIESSAFVGSGFSGLARIGSNPDPWIDSVHAGTGSILIDQFGAFKRKED